METDYRKKLNQAALPIQALRCRASSIRYAMIAANAGPFQPQYSD
jgi:hypothetical protein